VKRLEYKQREDRGPLHEIIGAALPLLQTLTKQLLETRNHTIEAALIMKLCLKILWSCTQFSLPVGIDFAASAPSSPGARLDGGAAEGGGRSDDPALLAHLSGWVQIMGAVIGLPLPEAGEAGASPAGQPTAAEERAAWPWWKLKKWALQVASRWFHRYGMPEYADDESQGFARFFSTTQAPLLLEPVMNTLALKPAGRFCSSRCTHLSLVFIESAVQIKTTYAALAPHVPSLLVNVVFPLLCLSEDDLELFEADPVECV